MGNEQDQTQQMRMLDEIVVSAATNADLVRIGVTSLQQLIATSERQLVSQSVSKKSILEIKDILGGMGLSLAPD